MATVIDAIIRLQDKMSDQLERVNQSLKQTERMAKEANKAVEKMGKGFNKAAKALEPLALASTAVIGGSIAAFSSFDDKYHAFLNKLDGDTKHSTALTRDAFLNMSKDIAMSADQLVGIADEIGGALGNATGEEINKLTQEVSRFAIATGTDGKAAADMITSALASFKIEAGNAGAAMDVIAQGANLSKASVTGLGESLKMTSASASMMNQDLETTVAALATLANNGVQGSEAGTGLSNVFERMANPAARKHLEDIGISVLDSSGKMRNLTEVVKDFNEKTANMTDTDKMNVALQAFGDVGSRSFMKLSAGASEFIEMNKKMKDSQGAVNDAYAEMQKSMGTSLQLIQNNFMIILLKVGERLAPIIAKVANEIQYLAEKMTVAEDGTADWIIRIAGAIIGIYALTSGIGTALSAISTISTALTTANTAITSAGGVFNLFKNNIKTFGSVIGGIFKNLTSILLSSFKSIVSGIRIMTAAMVSNPIIAAIVAIIVVVTLLVIYWDDVKKYAIKAWDAIKVGLSKLFNFMKAIFPTILTIACPPLGLLLIFWDDIVNGFKAGLAMLQNAFNAVGSWFMSSVVPTWNGAMSAIGSFFSDVWNNISSVATSTCNAIKSAINSVITSLNSVSFDIPDWVPNWGGKSFHLNIPTLFTGTENWSGGLARIHDQGGEIVDLPNGSRVIPHDKSIKEARNMGLLEGATVRKNTSSNVTIAKIADSIIIREEADINRIADTIATRLTNLAINRMQGAV